ncbi:MAG: winged helix-turn-helix transcriptional regulator [Candidatus Hadarchaeales archaeon]
MRSVRKSKGADILLRLLEGPKYIRELLSEVGGSAQTLEMRIQELMKDGLVEEETWEAWPFRKMLKLTDKGKEIAGILRVESSFLETAGKVNSGEVLRRGKILLSLLHAMGGRISGATRLQKLLFLMKREKGIETPYNFTPYMFGPHSPDVLEDAIDLERAGYISISREVKESTIHGDCVIERRYQLTPEGEKEARKAYASLPPETRKAIDDLKKFSEMRLTDLLRYVYTKYPKESTGV